MFKRMTAFLLAIVMLFSLVPPVSVPAAQEKSVEISNAYIRVSVNRENGGYVIATKEGDILKKTDNDVDLTHRGKNMDTSFTSFRINGEDFIFGNSYGFLGHRTTSLQTEVDPGGNFVRSTWGIDDIEIVQEINMVSSDISEQLGTALITYTVKNKSGADAQVKGRVLMDTQLGELDYGYYEIPNQKLGQGYEYLEFERTFDSTKDPFVRMPADYFVRDKENGSSIVGFGVNNVFDEQKPYRMTFANWSHIAATKFDYEPDPSANFTNPINDRKVADSAAALYYDLGTIAGNAEKSFSTYYGVTANLKNKDNKILINTTAPSKLEFTDDTHTEYKGSEADVGNNIVRVNVNVTNPVTSKKDFKEIAVVVYTTGFIAQTQNQLGEWTEYNNVVPMSRSISRFGKGVNKITYFDFKFQPQDQPQLGSFIIKIFDMDESVNELGVYAEEFCLGTTENFVILPGKDPSLPAITLAGLQPGILYNEGIRYMTLQGQGVSFFKSDLLDRIELRGENGKTYVVSTDGMTFGQTEGGEAPTEVTLQLNEYMDPGSYQLYFLWKPDATSKEQALQGVPAVFTSSAMKIQMSSDPIYRNDKYGIVTVQRDAEQDKKYKAVAYKDETAFREAAIPENDLILAIRGDIIQDNENKNLYRMVGKDRNVTINHILNYHGSDLSVEQKDDGSVFVLMDGKVTSIGANTTVRDGTAAFILRGGTEYLIPVYDNNGKIIENEQLSKGQDFVELKWNNSLDTLSTIGGFLINLKYGVLGKIQEGDGTKSDIISFGGGLDLSFMTPGAAKTARENKDSRSWTKQTDIVSPTFNDSSGKFAYCTEEILVEPDYKKPIPAEIGANVHDVLYGGRNPGYIGINMDAHATLPQIVSFLPNKIQADLSINTINTYEVGVEGEVKLAMLEMQMALVIKSNESGAPIPDKMYFTIGGFEPGLNLDSLGVVWLTGGGGGLENLYETIYGKDGVPPLTLLMNVQFDIFKALTGSADLSLSLRGVSVEFGELSLKKLKDARFIDGGMFGINWYPNFGVRFRAAVNFLEIMKGSMSITAEFGYDNTHFIELVLRVALGVPEFIPVVGGMELASAELGGGSEKVWGNITLLQIIRLGFIYYWGGDIEFTAGNVNETELMSTYGSDEGVVRTYALYEELTEPKEVGVNAETGETQFMSVGTNLSYVAGSTVEADFEEMAQVAETYAGEAQTLQKNAEKASVHTNTERTSHLVQINEKESYILTVSRADGTAITQADLEKNLNIKTKGKKYPLTFYAAPGQDATDQEKEQLVDTSNVNIVNGIAYIMIPETDLTAGQTFLLDFTDEKGYDVGAMRVNPVGQLTEQSASLKGSELTVNWKGTDLSDTAQIRVSVSEVKEEEGVVLNSQVIPAKYTGEQGSAKLQIPDNMASGEYYVTVVLSDEGKSYFQYPIEQSVNFVNPKAPEKPQTVKVSNVGNDKMKVDVTAPENSDKLNGYVVDIYSNDTADGTWMLADAGLYFDKDEEIIIGGVYDMPVMDENGAPVPKIDVTTGQPAVDEDGNVIYQTVRAGYTPGKDYKVKVRAANVEEGASEDEDDDILNCSAAVTSGALKLRQSTPPVVTIDYDKTTGKAKISSDCKITGELYVNSDIENWYAFNTAGTTFEQELNLEDGDHTLEFHGTDEDGDQVIIQEIFSVDTTPPILLLETPISGQSFSGDSIIVKGTGENDAQYTFLVNGQQITPAEGENIFQNGTLLSCTLPLGELAREMELTLEIRAVDPSGNVTEKEVSLASSKIAEINKISIYSDGVEETDGILNIGKGEKKDLRIMGSLPDGTKVDVTDLMNTQISINGGNSVALEGASITGKNEGRSLLEASFDIGGGRVLREGLIIANDPAINFEGLDAALEQAEKITQDGYTEESWNKLVQAIADGKNFRTMPGVSQEAVDNAANAILEAIKNLGKPVFYTVTFNSMEGTAVESQTIKENEKAVKPADPVREGYLFKGWYTDQDMTQAYNFDSNVTSSFTLYANWEKEKIPVSFTALDRALREAGKLNEKDYTDDTWSALEKAVKEGQAVRDKKDVTQEEVDNAATKIQDAMAKLDNKKAEYTVNFNSMGGTVVPAQKVIQDEMLVRPEDPVWEGYSFTGWFTDEQLTTPYNFGAPVKQSMTLYAGWEKVKIPPVYTGLENALEEAGKLVQDEYTPESWISLQNAVDAGKKILTSGDASQEEVDQAATDIINAIKTLIQKPAIYTVSFHTAGGSSIPAQQVTENETVAQPEDPVREGYTFDGWYTDEEFTKPYDFGTKVTASFTLFAKWEKKEVPEVGYPFVDVLRGDWFYPHVIYVNNKQIMQGTSQNTFTPNGEADRGLLAESLWKMDGKPAAEGKNPFTDVKDDRKEKDGITWAAEEGIMTEMAAGQFRPDQGVTREELVDAVYKYAQHKGYLLTGQEDLKGYKDLSEVSSDKMKAMEWAVGNGLLHIRKEGELDAKEVATRAEVAAILHLFMTMDKQVPLPTQKPTQEPTQKPTQKPTQQPTQKPTQRPTQQPRPTSAPHRPATGDATDLFTWQMVLLTSMLGITVVLYSRKRKEKDQK